MTGGIVVLAMFAFALVHLTMVAAHAPGFGGSPSPWFLYAANGDLWETDGTTSLQLTHNGHLTQPALSAQALVYVEREKSYSDLWLTGANQPARRLTHDASPIIHHEHWAAEPVFTPGGHHLYLLSDHDKATTGVGDLAVWEMDLLTRSLHQISHPPSYTGGDQDIAVDPRNNQLIIVTRYRYDPGGRLVEQLTALDLPRGRAVPLTNSRYRSRQAAFAPDGIHVAFVQTTGPSEDLYVGRLEQSPGQPHLVNVRRVASGIIAQPVWSPTGAALAYLALVGEQFQLWSLPVQPRAKGSSALSFGSPRQITHGPSIDATARPVWLTSTQAVAIRNWLNRGSP